MATDERSQPVQGHSRVWVLRGIQWGFAIALMAGLVIYVGPLKLRDTLRQVDGLWIPIVLALSLLLILLGATNVWILLSAFAKIGIRSFSRAYVSALAIGLVTPGQMGDASQVLLLKRSGVAYAESAAAYVLDKIITLVVFLAVVAMGISRYLLRVDFWKVGVLFLVAVLAIFFALSMINRINEPTGFLGRIVRFSRSFSDHTLQFRHHFGRVTSNLLVTILKWLVLSLCYISAFKAVATDVPLDAAMVVPVMSTLVGYLPITAGGIGTVEVSAVYLFGLEGIAEESVLAAYIILRATQFVLATILVMANRRTETIVKRIGTED